MNFEINIIFLIKSFFFYMNNKFDWTPDDIAIEKISKFPE